MVKILFELFQLREVWFNEDSCMENPSPRLLQTAEPPGPGRPEDWVWDVEVETDGPYQPHRVGREEVEHRVQGAGDLQKRR